MRAALALAALAALAACSAAPPKSADPGAPDPEDPAAPPPTGVLSHVPAATPYLIASIRRPPRAVIERAVHTQLDRLDRSLTLLGRLLAAEPEGKKDLDVETRLLLAAARELHGHTDVAGLRQLGLDLANPMALFGLGPYPALRLELADPAAFGAALERISGAAGVELDAGTLGGRRTFTVPLGQLLGVIAIDGDELSAALIPASMRGRLMPLVLGLERPRPSIAETHLISKLSRRHRLAGYRLGFLDVRRALEVILAPGAIDIAGKRGPAAIEILFPETASRLPRRCRSELASLGGAVPRVVFGPRESGRYRERGAVIVELSRGIAERLGSRLVPMPGLDSKLARGADLVAGLGIRPSALLSLGADAASRVAALDGCQLPELDPLRRELDQLARALALVGGIGVAITHLERDESGDVSRLAGAFAAAVDDPEALLALLSTQLPNSGLPPPGSPDYPKRVPVADPSIDPVWLWLDGGAAAVSVGLEGSAIGPFAAARSRDADDVAAVLRIKGAIAELVDREDPDPELEALDPELAREIADASETGVASVDVVAHATDRAISFDYDVRYRRDERAPRDRSPAPP